MMHRSDSTREPETAAENDAKPDESLAIPEARQPASDRPDTLPPAGSAAPDRDHAGADRDHAAPERSGAERTLEIDRSDLFPPEKRRDVTPEGDLEEWIEPLETPPLPDPLPEESVLTAPDGKTYQIAVLLRGDSQVRVYEAADPAGEPVRLYEALTDSATERLAREADVLRSVENRMFPALIAHFQIDRRGILVTKPPHSSRTLEQLLAENPPVSHILPYLAQVAYALKTLHSKGWVHLGIRPSAIALGKPVQLLDFSRAALAGEPVSRSFHYAGYTAPELLSNHPADPRSDIYSLGALLYRAVMGHPIGETGAELSGVTLPDPVGGAPQILHRTLGPLETRCSGMDELHADLLRLSKRLAPRIRCVHAAHTDIGLEPNRAANEDSFGILSGEVETETGAASWMVACVADGMGGMDAGEFASEAAVRAVMAKGAVALTRSQPPTLEEQVSQTQNWVHAANDAVIDALETRNARGGCALSCAVLVGRRLTVGHVGDCRIYRVRDDEIVPLTRDHSLVMSLVLQGEIALEEVRTHPDRSKITRSLGDRSPLPDYYIDTLEPVIGNSSLELLPGDLLLLCSDGLWEPVLESEMLERIRLAGDDLHAAARELIRLALKRGGPDNATLILIRLESHSA